MLLYKFLYIIANITPDNSPPRCAKFAIDPNPKSSNNPINPNISHTIINRYKPGGS
jgi:hypothetical protein